MPRTRTRSDADILEATARVVSRVGPGRLTLADVGEEVGLSPATLLQRFGSKRGLLLAFVSSSTADLAREFDEARAAHPSPLDALGSALVRMTRYFDTPEALANNLAFLQQDLTDPEFHQATREHFRAIDAAIESLLEAALHAKELVPCDTKRLARAVEAMWNGALLHWAIHRRGALPASVAEQLDTLLQPYRRPRRRRSPAKRS